MSRLLVHRILPAATACMSIALLASQQSAAQQTPSASAPVLVPAVRFEEDVVLPAKSGAAKKVRVVVSSWGIHGTGKIERFPEQGFMVIQLHSGDVTITVNGKEEKHRGGDFWTVPAGASLSVQVTSESAVLQTLVIRSPGK